MLPAGRSALEPRCAGEESLTSRRSQMNRSKFLLLAFAGLIMTGCVVREGGGYYGRGYGGLQQAKYLHHRGDFQRPRGYAPPPDCREGAPPPPVLGPSIPISSG